MQETITGTIESVTGREVRSGTIFDVVIGGVKLATFKEPVAQEARALQGSDVEATVNVEQKGDYTNRTLLGLKLVNAIGRAHTPSTGSGSNVQPETHIAIAPSTNDDTAARIARSVAFEHLPNYIEVSGYTESAIFVSLNTFATWIYNGSKPGQEPVAAVAAEPAESNDGIPW